MYSPEGFVDFENPNMHTNNTKHYTNLAPHAWFEKLKSTLFNWGFAGLKVDTSLFIYSEGCNSFFFFFLTCVCG